MLDHLGSRKISGGQTMTHLAIAGGAYVLLLAAILIFNHSAHMR